MITEDQIAAATMAQLFGSELLRVDQTTLERPGSISQATQLDPKRFLVGQQQNNAYRNDREAQLLEALYREAELSHPLPQAQAQSPVSAPPAPAQTQATQIVHGNALPTPQAPVSVPAIKTKAAEFNEEANIANIDKLAKTLIKMNDNLERIANILEGVEIKKKKSTLLKRS